MKKVIKTQMKKLRNFNPKLKEECGVFGISNAKDATDLPAIGIHDLQPRVKEGWGFVKFPLWATPIPPALVSAKKG